MTEPTTSDWVFGVKELNAMIQDSKNRMPDKFSPGDISDGYHTFNELYEHRYVLWLKLCELIYGNSGYPNPTLRAKRNHDGSSYEGYFILGYKDPETHEQISYHLPMKYWDKAYFAVDHDIYPDFDGHTSADVLKRLGEL